MLKQLVLLLLIGVNFNLYGSERCFSHIISERLLSHRKRGVHEASISKEKIDAVLSDLEVLKLFEAVDRLLSVLPRKSSDSKCICIDQGIHDTINLNEAGILCTPWTYQFLGFDIHNVRELLISNGFKFEDNFFLDKLRKIKITALDGEALPSRNLSAIERCEVFAAWQQQTKGWSPARSAWVGSVVRSGNARNPVVVAAELKE